MTDPPILRDDVLLALRWATLARARDLSDGSRQATSEDLKADGVWDTLTRLIAAAERGDLLLP